MTSILPDKVQFRPDELVMTTHDDGTSIVHHFPTHTVFAKAFLDSLPETAWRFGKIVRQPVPEYPKEPFYDDSLVIDADNGAGLYRLAEPLEDGSREGVIESLRHGLIRGKVLRDSALTAAIEAAIANAESEADAAEVEVLREEFKWRLA